MTYKVKEIHDTLQGEGYHAGARVILVRFSGCNVWSGLEEDRERGRARCSLWCDTEFRGGDVYTAPELAARIADMWGEGHPRVLITGGEPALQYDRVLYDELKRYTCTIHLETNGSLPIKAPVDWCTVSPKAPLPVVVKPSEIKLVYPGDDPELYVDLTKHLYLQPQAGNPEALTECLKYIRRDDRWRLSVQTHKFLKLP